jgi:antirestriction protein ArdC
MNIYEAITQRIRAQLEHGTVPWQKPWNHTAGLPRNLRSQKASRGINVGRLASAGYSSPYWLTYRPAQEIGGHGRTGHGIRAWGLALGLLLLPVQAWGTTYYVSL